MASSVSPCPACGALGHREIYRQDSIPVHSVVLLRNEQEAKNYRRGQMSLMSCESCGFLWNDAFDPSLLDYSNNYESTQLHSAVFSTFLREMTDDLIKRHDLRGRKIIEIGCGQGEFLKQLCEQGGNEGLGFDPAYASAENPSDKVRFIADYYGEEYAHESADFVCCRMTLEHIPDVARFLRSIRKALIGNAGAEVFFQVPDAGRILDIGAFWDIYYEHCSYFTRASLGTLFLSQGFTVSDIWSAYSDQYLMIEAKPDREPGQHLSAEPAALIDPMASDFDSRACAAVSRWQQNLANWRNRGEKGVLWGAGSKAVAFLAAVQGAGEIRHAVDVNPRKQGTYLPGGGEKVLAPGDLLQIEPDYCIVMNEVYRDEIRAELDSLGLSARLITVEEGTSKSTERIS